MCDFYFFFLLMMLMGLSLTLDRCSPSQPTSIVPAAGDAGSPIPSGGGGIFLGPSPDDLIGELFFFCFFGLFWWW